MHVLCFKVVKPWEISAKSQGSKQHGHMISRSDYVSDARKSVTVVTSVWSSGHAGPLAICVPDAFMKQADMDSFNDTWHGQAMIFPSQSTSHFMCAETFIVYLHKLLTPALARKRATLGVARDTPALLLADGWTGFHSHKTGLDCARQAWSSESSCRLPATQDR